jgi:twitching motility protein PilT
LVNSLLTAIVRADGDALVMHVGELPYVVAPSGPVELSSRPLTAEAVAGMLSQLLPADSRRALDELGAIEHELPRSILADGDRFTVVVARGGDDIWIEIRRDRTTPADTPLEMPANAAKEELAEGPTNLHGPVEPPDVAPTAPAVASATCETPAPVLPSPALELPAATRSARIADPVAPPTPEPTGELSGSVPSESRQAIVVPLARSPVRTEAPARPAPPLRIAGLDRLLRLAAARGANTLYLTSSGRPSIRVDGEIAAIDGEPVLTAPEVESLLLDLAPERNREALRNGLGTEWMSNVPDVGGVRCQSFRDHRGPGGIFRIIATRPTPVDQLGLSREIQSLCTESEGLILVAGPRSSGKSTLISAFVDLINRTRNDYVITIESQIACAHESRGCLVSQREERGTSEEVAAVVRAALRENPDVLVIEDLRSSNVVALALEAVESGHLVIGAMSTHTTTTAIGRILDQCPPERRDQVQLVLAEGLRGVVSQVLVRKAGGGRVAAREVLLNTPAIASLIAEGRISQLPLALDSGRKHGMVPLNDALAGFVQNGIVDVKDAYRKAFERPAFLAVLRREGIDTSFADRLA